MKASRLLSALLLLQSRQRISTRELAERLQISQRTAHRDMESLGAAGIPLLAIRGSQGGWELLPGWRTKIPALTAPELRALVLAQPGAAAERAIEKLIAAMPQSMQTEAASIRATVYIDPVGWHPGSDDLSMLPIVQEAAARAQRLTFTYKPPDRPAEPRTVDPLGTVWKQGLWYLVARTPAGMRTYRISRISQAAALPETFERPGKFDLATYWHEATRDLQQQRQTVTATLALSPDALATLRKWRPVTEGQTRSRRKLPPDWTLMDVSFESTSQARFVVLGFGKGAKLLAPEGLRAEVAAEARAMASGYARA